MALSKNRILEKFVKKILVSDCDNICRVDIGDSSRVGLGIGDFFGEWFNKEEVEFFELFSDFL